MVKTRKVKTMNLVKDTMKIGMTTMVGQGVLGSMANLPGMPSQAKGTANIAGSALNLANIGQLGKVGMSLTKDFSKNCRLHKNVRW